MLIFAHRGASNEAPENTLLAISKALTHGVDGIEIDVHCVDGELVVIHDRWLQRTTNGSGNIAQCSFSDLRLLDAGQGERIPTLDEVLLCIAGKCAVNIELKGLNDVVPVLQCIDNAMASYGFNRSQFLISSFNHHLLFEIKQIRPELFIGALTASVPLDYAAFAERLDAYSVHVDINALNKAFVTDAKQRGIVIYAYTVDEDSDFDELEALGVDGVFTNCPSKALVRRAHSPRRVVPLPLAIDS